MATTKKIITVDEGTLSIREVLEKGTSAQIENIIAAKVILDDQIAQLKAIVDQLTQTITATPYSSVTKELVDRGVIGEEDKPAIEVKTKLGATITVHLNGDIDSGFTVSDALKDKEVLDSVVPDKYKKINVTLDKKALEKDYDNDLLPSVLKGYCSKHPTEVLKLRRNTSK